MKNKFIAPVICILAFALLVLIFVKPSPSPEEELERMKENHVREVMRQYGEWAKEENARQMKAYEDSLAATDSLSARNPDNH